MKTFIVAIPLFNSKLAVYAYKLCDRNATKLLGTANDYQEVGESLRTPGLSIVAKVGVEPFAGEKKLFIDVNQYQLLIGVPGNMGLDPSSIICILPCTTQQDEKIVNKCSKLLENGYSLALRGYPQDGFKNPFLNMAEYIVLDFGAKDYTTQMKSVMPLLTERKVVIENVPDRDKFNNMSSIPNAVFGGGFYSQPITKGVSDISPLKINALQLLNQVNSDDFDLIDVAKIIERDPSISLQLLRSINSRAIGRRQKISSIRSAVSILGQREMKRWVNVAISLTLAEDRPGEIAKLSLVRAKFAENLAIYYELGVFAPSLFMAGLFSLLDVILEKPMEEAIKEINVEKNVELALVKKSGPLYPVLDLIYGYERANWDWVSINMVRHNVEPEDISNAFINALIWYKELLEEIEDIDEAQEINN